MLLYNVAIRPPARGLRSSCATEMPDGSDVDVISIEVAEQHALAVDGVLFLSMLMCPFEPTRMLVTGYRPSHKNVNGNVTSSVASSVVETV